MALKNISKHIIGLADSSGTEFHQRPARGPFAFVSKQATLDYGDNGTYTVVIYGAYSAGGLMGTERNGIGILDETRRLVLLDEHQSTNTGYVTPTERQSRSFDDLINSDWVAFRNFVNSHDRARYAI